MPDERITTETHGVLDLFEYAYSVPRDGGVQASVHPFYSPAHPDFPEQAAEDAAADFIECNGDDLAWPIIFDVMRRGASIGLFSVTVEDGKIRARRIGAW